MVPIFLPRKRHSLSKFAYAGTPVQFGGPVSFAPEVATGDFTPGKVTCPLQSGTTFVFVLCLYSHLVVFFFAVVSFLPSLLCAEV